jgi:two-component system, chemotaxis family, protein-glutamate methylesterase/glutaminase
VHVNQQPSTARRDVILIGASAGGVEALRGLVGGFPADLAATVLVVLHMPPFGTSVLPDILSRAGKLPARVPVSGEHLTPGTIFVARPDRHLVCADSQILLTRGPHESGHRPSIDALFRTAARALGPRVISVVLSGMLDDGTAGSLAVHQRGGLVVAQDPSDAMFPSMPRHVVELAAPDLVAPAAELGPRLAALVLQDPTHPEPPPSQLLSMEADLAMMEDPAMHSPDRPGVPAGYSCPDCAGSLFQIEDEGLLRFRCRVGHAWSAAALIGEQSAQLDSALWVALRSLEEKAALARDLGDRAEARGSILTRDRYRHKANEAVQAAALIRSVLEAGPVVTDEIEEENA